MDVYRNVRLDALRERALFRPGRALFPAPFYSHRLPLLHREPDRVLRAHARAAHRPATVGRSRLLRLGERLQSFRRDGVLGVHDGCLQHRAGKAALRFHQRGRQPRRHCRGFTHRRAGGSNRHGKFALRLRSPSGMRRVVRPLFPDEIQGRTGSRFSVGSEHGRASDRRQPLVGCDPRRAVALPPRYLRIPAPLRHHEHARLFPTGGYHRPSIPRSRGSHHLLRADRHLGECAHDHGADLSHGPAPEMARSRTHPRDVARDQLGWIRRHGRGASHRIAGRLSSFAPSRKLCPLASRARSALHRIASRR